MQSTPTPPITAAELKSRVARKARAVLNGSPDEIRAANHSLNAAHIERAIVDNLAKDDGIADEDRARLCALLHGEALR